LRAKTKLEEDLEKVHERRGWGRVVILLLILLFIASFYIFSFNQKLHLAQKRIRSLQFEVETLKIKLGTREIDSARKLEQLPPKE
jgi:hypothetical protein